MSTLTPRRPLSSEELDALDCCLGAGLIPTQQTVARMMATIRELQRGQQEDAEMERHAVSISNPQTY